MIHDRVGVERLNVKLFMIKATWKKGVGKYNIGNV